MNRMALTMLFGRPGKYAAMVFAMSFSVLLITQQIAIFLGVLRRATGPLQNIANVDIWVSTDHTEYVDMSRGVDERHLHRVQSIPGVAWAKPLLSLKAMAETSDGTFTAVQLIGIDRTTLVGQPPAILEGNLTDLRGPNAIMLEASQRHRLPEVGIGDRFQLNDQKARVVGICRAKCGILSRPLVYTTYDNAVGFSRTEHHPISWILVKAKPGADVAEVCRDIHQRLGLLAVSADGLKWQTVKYIIQKTSIGLNFLVTIVLGSLVGLVVSTATFNQFTSDCLPHFAVLKAIGTSSRRLCAMIFIQGLTAGLISYGIGLGLATLTSLPGRSPDAQLTVHFPWQLLVVAVVPMIVCMLLGSLVSLWRVLRVDPVVVFQ